MIRDELPPDNGFRPGFLGHIIVELLLDDCLAADDPASLAAYYDAVDSVDPEAVMQFVADVTGKPVERLAELIPRFVQERFLYDYADDAKLLFRLNNVMGRVGLAQIPEAFLSLLPRIRAVVRDRKDELLTPPA